MNFEKLFGRTPYIELLIRKIYYNSSIAKKIKLNQDSKGGKPCKTAALEKRFGEVKKYIDTLGFQDGDIVIVHSSIEQMQGLDAKPNEILEYLISLVGDHGTLVIPAFPLYTGKSLDADKNAPVYNPKRTLCATGMIPNLFLRTEGVTRSKFPWNTLAAKGPCSEEMMENNLNTDLAHGKNSAWEYCVNKQAKILLLGVKSSHTTTAVHVAEDILDNKWPIDDWYEEKKFLVRDSDEEQLISVRIRKQKWSVYNASWYRSYCFKKNGLLVETEVEGINVGFIPDSKQMVNYIIARTLDRKPFFVVPKKSFKKSGVRNA